MALALLSVSLISCSSDDDDDDSGSTNTELIQKLQGSWAFQRGTETIMGMTITMDRSSLDEMRRSMEQAMGEKVEFWDETLTFNGNKVNGTSFTLNGNQIILEGMDIMDGISISVKSVNSSKLVLRESISLEGLSIDADMEYRKM